MPVEIVLLSFCVFVCACRTVISSIFVKSFHFPFSYFVFFYVYPYKYLIMCQHFLNIYFLFFFQPLVTRNLIVNCKPIADILKKKFGTRKLYKYHIERDKHQEISFKMLNSNISQLISHLDDIRRDPK